MKRVLLLPPYGADVLDEEKKMLMELLPTVGVEGPFCFLHVGAEYKSAVKQKSWTYNDYSAWPAYVSNDKVAGVYRYDLIVFTGAEVMSRTTASGNTVNGWHIGPVNLKLIGAMVNNRKQPSYLLNTLNQTPSLVTIDQTSKIYAYQQMRQKVSETHAILQFNDTEADNEQPADE